MCNEGTVVGSVCVCLSVTLHLTSRVFVRLTKDMTYLTGNEGQKFRTVFSETAPLEREKGNMQIHNGLVHPHALRTSEAPEDATQGVYRLLNAISELSISPGLLAAGIGSGSTFLLALTFIVFGYSCMQKTYCSESDSWPSESESIPRSSSLSSNMDSERLPGSSPAKNWIMHQRCAIAWV